MGSVIYHFKDFALAIRDGFRVFKFILATYFFTFARIPRVMKFLDIKYVRSRSNIEIDITYACQLKCFNCNRSCTQAPTEEYMTIEQIKKFIQESITSDIKWERIRIIGGEPTLHPDLLKILDLLIEYKKNYSNDSCLQLATNGFGKEVNDVLRRIPGEVEIYNTNKRSAKQLFGPFNIAPQDRHNYKPGNYSNGCINLIACGIGLSPYGYYCCTPAAGIDRIFSFDIGRKGLPKDDDPMSDHLETFCKLCGMFGSFYLPRKEVMSPTWKAAYEKYKRKRPNLTLY